MSTNTELIVRSERVASELDDHNANMDRRARTCIRELVAALKSMEQAITDPENQPSQFGTVLLATQRALEAELKNVKAVATNNSFSMLIAQRERDALQSQLAAAQGQSWSDDQMIRFAWLILNRQNDDDSIEQRLNVFRERDLSAPIPQQPAPSAPEGWKLVPIEPTLEMMREGGRISRPDPPTTRGVHACGIYRAMLAAAPQPKETK